MVSSTFKTEEAYTVVALGLSWIECYYSALRKMHTKTSWRHLPKIKIVFVAGVVVVWKGGGG